MKRAIASSAPIAASIACTVIVAVLLCGCKPATTPLPTGAINTVDAQINAILQAAHAAEVQYSADVTGGFVPTAAYAALMGQLKTALNTADPLYIAYHQQLTTSPLTAEPAQLVTATANVQTLLGQIPGTVGK